MDRRATKPSRLNDEALTTSPTTSAGRRRAISPPFGTRGSRLLSFFNWLTQLGFETEGLILIVGAGLVLSQMAGIHTSSGLKVAYIILAAAIQAVMPYLGHATMVKVLRALIIP